MELAGISLVDETCVIHLEFYESGIEPLLMNVLNIITINLSIQTLCVNKAITLGLQILRLNFEK